MDYYYCYDTFLCKWEESVQGKHKDTHNTSELPAVITIGSTMIKIERSQWTVNIS